MEQIIVTHLDNSTTKLQSKENVSTITRANQKVELLGADTVEISVESATKLNFYIGDKITVIGRDYTLNTPAKERKLSERKFVYDMVFEGVQYDLLRVSYSVNVDTTSNEIQDLSGDSLTGDLKMFLDVLLSNANRVFPGKWVLGTYPTDTETKTLTFGDSDNCLSVLQSLCSEGNYNTEFSIGIAPNGVRTLNIGATGNVFPYTFQYGKGKGLYELTREKVSSTNIVTRLSVYGSSRNINTSKYRAFRLCLPGKTKGQSYLESAAGIASYGVWEQTKNFEEIYPRRLGEVTAFDAGAANEFNDSTMNFDLNETDVSGNTLYLIPGAAAKIHFNTGNLAGYEFEITEYNHSTKQFKIKPFTDENGFTFPSVYSSSFQPAVGDKYVILDIYLPQSYIDAAESELQAAGQEYLDKYSQPNVMYGLTVDPLFLKDVVGAEVEANIVWVGDYIPVKDTDLDVDKSIRVKGFTRDLLKDYAYSLTIADLAVTVSTINRVVSDLRGIDNLVRINNLNDPARARKNYLNSQEVLSMIFDQEGDFYTDKIKPLSIDTTMLSVGAKYSQFGMMGTLFQPNYGGAKNRVVYTGGALTHYAILDGSNNPRTWSIGNGDVVLANDGAFYIYAKCQKDGASGSILFSTAQMLADDDLDFYHFLIGVINSAGDDDERAIALMYGFTTINGRFIKTGRVQSADGSTFFDLDTGEIQGKISFSSGSSGYNNLSDKPDLSVYSLQDDVDALTANLQAQIDGQIMTYFYDYVPTLANAPANGWTTTEDKDKHLGDLFYNSATGLGYRYSKVGTAYSWQLLKDTDVATALANAAAAQTTANSKKRVFLVQPTTPYEAGDLWTQGTAGELMRCKTTRITGSYTVSDWEKAVKYTDDTAVNNLEIGGRNILKGSEAKSGSQWSLAALQPTFTADVVDGNACQRVTFTESGGFTALSLYQSYNPTEVTDLLWAGRTLVASVQLRAEVNANFRNFRLGIRWQEGGTQNHYTYSEAFSIVAGQWMTIHVKVSDFPFHLWDKTSVTVYFVLESSENWVGRTLWIRRNMLSFSTTPTDWTPAPEDVQAEIDAYNYLKEAMQNATDIQGGLLSTTLIKLGAVNNAGTWVEKAGINGAGTSDYTPRLYAGGTLQQADNRIAGQLTNAAKFVVTQGGKIFGMEVELFGSISTAPPGGRRIHLSQDVGAVNIHDDTGRIKAAISAEPMPSLSSLLHGHTASANVAKFLIITTNTKPVGKSTLTGTTTSIVLSELSASHKVTTPPVLCYVQAQCNTPFDLGEASAYVRVRLRSENGYYKQLGRLFVTANWESGNQDNIKSITIPSQEISGLAPGTYYIELYSEVYKKNANDYGVGEIEIKYPNDVLSSLAITDVSWIFNNGIYLVRDSNNYMYINPYGVKERFENAPDRPGVLASASVLSGGGHTRGWGPKLSSTQAAKTSTGEYRLYHTIGHRDYTVQITPLTSARLSYISTRTTTYVDVYLTNTSGTAIDTAFDYCIIGNN